MNERKEPESRDESGISYEQDAQKQVFDSQGDRYEFRVKGYLAPRWLEWLGGLTIANPDNGGCLLTGSVVDPAALYGLLARVRDLNLSLISVNRIELAAAWSGLGASDAAYAAKEGVK